jgi:hypothetical protein
MGKKNTRKKQNRLSRTASSDPTPKNKIETLTASHHRIAMITSRQKQDGECCFHTKITPNAEPKTRQDCALVTPKKKGWHKFCIQVQFYTVASDTYFAPACAKIRTKA